MEACYEYLGCKKQDCTMLLQKDNKPCWEVEETSCNNEAIKVFAEQMPEEKKEVICAAAECIYYRHVNEPHIVMRDSLIAIFA